MKKFMLTLQKVHGNLALPISFVNGLPDLRKGICL